MKGMTTMTVADVLDRLSALADTRIRVVNERHGDDHAVNLTKLRGLAKEIGTDQELAAELWATDDSAARLVALLVGRPREFGREEIDAMLRQARTPKVQDWLISYVVKKNPAVEDLRQVWISDPAPEVAAAGWTLTAARVAKNPDGLDLDGLLDTIETTMGDAPARQQWSMNECLAQIGINQPGLRSRAIAIGERLGVLKDYPTAPNCTSPYAPVWIEEMVRRRSDES